VTPDQFEQIELHFRQYTAQQVIDEGILFDVEPRVIDSVWQGLVFGLKAHILSDHLPPERVRESVRVAYQVPSSTWQMWKKRHAGSWYARRLVERWPVRYETDPDGRGEIATCEISLERFQIYPESRLRVSDHGRAVRMYARNTDWTFGEAP
jgi:hypothetical protein